MKPLFSDEEKAKAVRNFLIALQNNQGKIKAYVVIASRLNSESIKPLCNLGKSGKEHIGNDTYGRPQYDSLYSDTDARIYFEWLSSVVSGTSQGEVSDTLIRDAINQLFHFIQILQTAGSVELDKRVELVEIYDWQAQLLAFDGKLSKIRDSMEERDEGIIELLTTLKDFMVKNQELLTSIVNEQESILGEKR